MSPIVAIVLFLSAATLLVLELRGVRTTLQLSFRGDIKRETAFLAQYGQAVATIIAGWLMAIAEGDVWRAHLRVFTIVCGPVLLVSVAAAVLKRICGRHRPNRERAGAFTGFAWRHDNKRESFPSSHSACAFALTVSLIHYFPEAAVVFWLLAFTAAGLRYVLDAHFPSDVLAGALLGLALGHAGVTLLESIMPPA